MIPEDRVLPSEDGDVWLFFMSTEDGYQTTPFCFFVPGNPAARSDLNSVAARSDVFHYIERFYNTIEATRPSATQPG